MTSDVRTVIDRLAQQEVGGVPALVVADSFDERATLVEALSSEAAVHGISLVVIDELSTATERAEALSVEADQALVLLIGLGQGALWGEWLDAYRDRFPLWARFVLVVVFRRDQGELLRNAPAFFSLVKGMVFSKVRSQAPTIPAAEVLASLAQMTAKTSLSPAQFIAAWRAGKVEDTFENNNWVQLAQLVTAQAPDDAI